MARYSYSPYETRGEVIVDTRTGLTHDAGEAAKWQKQYRWLREWCGEKNPGRSGTRLLFIASVVVALS